MGFVSRHLERDLFLPKYRDALLENALKDLKGDPRVMAIYLAGSLARGDFDHYSDIDLHMIVTAERKAGIADSTYAIFQRYQVYPIVKH